MMLKLREEERARGKRKKVWRGGKSCLLKKMKDAYCLRALPKRVEKLNLERSPGVRL